MRRGAAAAAAAALRRRRALRRRGSATISRVPQIGYIVMIGVGVGIGFVYEVRTPVVTTDRDDPPADPTRPSQAAAAVAAACWLSPTPHPLSPLSSGGGEWRRNRPLRHRANRPRSAPSGAGVSWVRAPGGQCALPAAVGMRLFSSGSSSSREIVTLARLVMTARRPLRRDALSDLEASSLAQSRTHPHTPQLS